MDPAATKMWLGAPAVLLPQGVREDQVEIEFEVRFLEPFGQRRKAADRGDDLLDPGVDVGVARAALDSDAPDRAVLVHINREDRLAAAAAEEGERQEVEMVARQRG